MRISKEAAIRIAEDFIAKDGCKHGPLQSATFETAKDAKRFAQNLGVDIPDYRDEWWVSFELIDDDPNVLYSSPDEITVVVDDESGEARFRPTL